MPGCAMLALCAEHDRHHCLCTIYRQETRADDPAGSLYTHIFIPAYLQTLPGYIAITGARPFLIMHGMLGSCGVTGVMTVLQLMREAEVHLGQLTSMLRTPGVSALPGTVAIVAVKAAGSIAQQRPFFFSKVLPALLGLGHLAKVCS